MYPESQWGEVQIVTTKHVLKWKVWSKAGVDCGGTTRDDNPLLQKHGDEWARRIVLQSERIRLSSARENGIIKACSAGWIELISLGSGDDQSLADIDQVVLQTIGLPDGFCRNVILQRDSKQVLTLLDDMDRGAGIG